MRVILDILAEGLGLEMGRTYHLRVETRGGVQDLGRVVGVLALYDITPRAIAAHGDERGLQIEMQIGADSRTRGLCAARLRAIASVVDVRIGPSSAEAPKGEPWTCRTENL